LFLVNDDHLAILKKGVEAWNKWRQENPSIEPDLSGADLEGEILAEVDFCRTNLSKANLNSAILREANLFEANFEEANLTWSNFFNAYLMQAKLVKAKIREADFSNADLTKADLSEADLSESTLNNANLCEATLDQSTLIEAELKKADLSGANLKRAKLDRADLEDAKLLGANLTDATLTDAKLVGAFFAGAILTDAKLIKTDLTLANLSHADLTRVDFTGSNMVGTIMLEPILDGAILSDCRVYGISAWKLKGLQTAKQSNLIITYWGEPVITVDNLEVAQFIYLLLHSEKIRDVINTVGNKGVLILGRFGERKYILEAIQECLREMDYIPMLFDFDKPVQRDFTETVKTLACMSRFIIADITKPKSVPLELQATVPDFMIPMVTIIEKGEEPFAMFQDLWIKYRDWVLKPMTYESVEQLKSAFKKGVVDIANSTLLNLEKRKAEKLETRDALAYI